MTKSRGIGRGGARPGAGRKCGGRNPQTKAMLAELDRHRDPAMPYLLPSVFLRKVMEDENAPLTARIMCAAKVIPFIERKPASAIPDEIPLFRYWTDTQYEDFERRTREDMRRDPLYYGREVFEAFGEPWPVPHPQLSEARPPPSDRWFAEIDSKIDQRRHKGGPKPWAPGERERLLRTPFHPEERARWEQNYKLAPEDGEPSGNGIDPDKKREGGDAA